MVAVLGTLTANYLRSPAMSFVKILAPLTGGARDVVVLSCAFAAATSPCSAFTRLGWSLENATATIGSAA